MMSGSQTARKSCDLCYRRKFRCDRAKPKCSHCITYVTDCTYEAPSRKARAKKRQNCAKTDARSTTGHTQDQDRSRKRKGLVEQFGESVKVGQQRDETPNIVDNRQPSSRSLLASQTILTPSDEVAVQSTSLKHNVTMALPPLEHVLPIITIFLKTFNAALPLFHDGPLLRLIHNFYTIPYPRRDPVSWAAINIILALAHRHDLIYSTNPNLSIEYLNKAESVLSSIVLGETKLLNIQVLVGMVLLLQASPDLTPSLIMIGTTLRLAHKIGLHDRNASTHLGDEEKIERACVFWIAYILDKDLSMRSKQPSIQLDDDVDLKLPSSEVVHAYQVQGRNEWTSEDRKVPPGIIGTADGRGEMNYLEIRVQLAVIQGGVYDYLFSTRSLKRSMEERSQALESIASALETWKSCIPWEFSACKAAETVEPFVLQLLAVLHSTALACTTMLNQANAWSTYWMEGIRRYAIEGVLPALPDRWEEVVREARELGVLLGAVGWQNRWNFWTTGCTHMTAMLLLTFNSMQRPHHDQISFDDELVDSGLRMLEKVAEETNSEIVRDFCETCTGLRRDVKERRGEGGVLGDA